jgi:hypothetical protein
LHHREKLEGVLIVRTVSARAAVVGLGVAGLLALAAPAAADWLVMQDGSRLETRGAWTVAGNLIRFTLASGALASLRASEVDLEASAEATRAARDAASSAPVPVPPKKRAVLVLTDANIRSVAEEASLTPSAGSEKTPAVAAANAVVVADWSSEYDTTELATVVSGTVRNISKDVAGGIALTVTCRDDKGETLGSVQAALSASSLPPDGRATFRAVFPDITGMASAQFAVKSVPVKTREGWSDPPPAQLDN